MDCGYCVDCCWLNRRPNLKLETTASCFVSDKKTPRLRMSNTRPWCFYCRASPDLLFRVLNVYSGVMLCLGEMMCLYTCPCHILIYFYHFCVKAIAFGALLCYNTIVIFCRKNCFICRWFMSACKNV